MRTFVKLRTAASQQVSESASQQIGKSASRRVSEAESELGGALWAEFHLFPFPPTSIVDFCSNWTATPGKESCEWNEGFADFFAGRVLTTKRSGLAPVCDLASQPVSELVSRRVSEWKVGMGSLVSYLCFA